MGPPRWRTPLIQYQTQFYSLAGPRASGEMVSVLDGSRPRGCHDTRDILIVFS